MSQSTYRAEIDGLRAIAVLSVVLYHADLGLPAGQTGVDVFFVISGYLITLLLHREWSIAGRIDFPAFYARRVRRIIPALVLVIVASVAASLVLLSPHGASTEVARSAAASLLFAGNFFFQFHSGGYFDPSAESLPLLHLWSLGVEEQFYLLWPLALVLVLHGRPAASRAIVAVAALLSLALAEMLIFRGSNAAFYQMPPRFWELAAGGLVALRAPDGGQRGELSALIGLLVVAAAAVIPVRHFPGLGALPAVAGAALVLHAVHVNPRPGLAGALLRSPGMVFVGRISYSLYLWHWPPLALARALHPGVLPLPARLLICAFAVAAAWLSFRFVEQPLRRPDTRSSNLKLVAVAMLSLVALAFCLHTAGSAIYRPAPPDDLASRTARDQPQNRIRCNYSEADPVDVLPRPGCTSAEDQPLRVVIWGDSHALAWQPFAWALAQQQGVAATGYTRDACKPALGYDNGKRPAVAESCRAFNQWVVGRLDGIDTLVMTAAWPVGERFPDFASKFEATMAQLAPRIPRLILLGPTPDMRDNVPKCIEAGDLPACAVSRRDFDAQNGEVRALLQSLAARYPNVKYVDPADFFCDRETCPPLKDGYGLYWDSNHITSTAAGKFAAQYLGTKP